MPTPPLPLYAFHGDAKRLDLAGFAAKHGDAFLVVTGGDRLSVKDGRPVTRDANPAETTGSLAVTVYPVPVRLDDEPAAKVGRGEHCDVAFVGDTTVSKEHAEARVGDGGMWIVDLVSRNGTTVNGVAPATEKAPMFAKPGDTVRFGAITAIFVDARGLIDLVRRFRGAY